MEILAVLAEILDGIAAVESTAPLFVVGVAVLAWVMAETSSVIVEKAREAWRRCRRVAGAVQILWQAVRLPQDEKFVDLVCPQVDGQARDEPVLAVSGLYQGQRFMAVWEQGCSQKFTLQGIDGDAQEFFARVWQVYMAAHPIRVARWYASH